MMTADGQQDVLVWVVVAVAVGYLAWRSWQTFVRRGADRCGGCESAGQMDAAEGTDRASRVKPFVSIEEVESPFSPDCQAGKGKENP